MQRTVTITTAHLVAALSVPWGTKTCLIAQALGGPLRVDACGATVVDFTNKSRGEFFSPEVIALQSKFDRLRTEDDYSRDSALQAVAEIAAALPLSFDMTETGPTGAVDIKITRAHLEAARSVPWNNNTCLLAQALGGPDAVQSCGVTCSTMKDGRGVHHPSQKAQALFDQAYRPAYWMSQEVKEAAVAELEALLPVSVQVTFNSPGLD